MCGGWYIFTGCIFNWRCHLPLSPRLLPITVSIFRTGDSIRYETPNTYHRAISHHCYIVIYAPIYKHSSENWKSRLLSLFRQKGKKIGLMNFCQKKLSARLFFFLNEQCEMQEFHLAANFFIFFLATKKKKKKLGSARRAMRQKWVHILMRTVSWDKPFFFLDLILCWSSTM